MRKNRKLPKVLQNNLQDIDRLTRINYVYFVLAQLSLTTKQ